MFGRTLLRVRIRAADFFVEADDVAHALFEHWLLDPVAAHGNELIRPEFLEVAYFAGGHDDRAGYDQRVVLQKFKFFEAKTRENVAVVGENLHCVSVGPHGPSKAVGREDDSLTEEVAEHIVDRNELDLPAKGLEHVLFLRDKLFVAVGDADVVKQLVDSWVGLLQILCADEETR